VTDMLLAVLTLAVILAVGCVVGIGFVVVPFVLTVDMAERRGFSTTRWGAIALVDLALASAAGLLVMRHSALLLVVAAALAWAAPAALSLMDRTQVTLGGRQGGHQV
jgi:hypothetical protein